MPKKKCEKGKAKEKPDNKEFYCGKCGAVSNNKDKLCKPKKSRWLMLLLPFLMLLVACH